jgi:beta-phosphoglucomutase-like phosphatase (HAD superfamily)
MNSFAFDAIIWDLDGTLADTHEIHHQAWMHTMAALGIPFTYEMFVASFGRNNAEMLAEQLPDPTPAKIAEVAADKEAYYRSLLGPGSPVTLPGVDHWLAEFDRLGLVQCVGSSAPMANIVAMIEVLGIADYFHALVSGVRLPKGKPDPAIFRLCAAAAGVEQTRCLVVEDSIFGIEAAQRAGMASVAVGSLAQSPILQPYLQPGAHPPVLALSSLADAPDVEEILEAARQRP